MQALTNQDITLFGDGGQTRSFCYVDDLVGALIRMMETPSEITGPINVGNPCEFTMRDLAELVVELTGSHSRLVHLPLPPDDPKQRQPDITRAREVLGWEPKIELREGLLKTISYFDDLLRNKESALAIAASRDF